ncbi:MAG: RNA polymerase factor sigma-54 [Phycisphaeraceae bacterium]|nr:RNA polymerase factor sigma-54 [Phycisphaeraceae bacterium]
MRFDATQSMRLGQQMRLAPRMIQSMEILQMPILQLEERIAQELEGNVTLEVAEEGDEGLAGDGRVEGVISPGGAESAREAMEELAAERAVDRPLELDSEHGADDFSRLDAYEHDVPEMAENDYEVSAGPGASQDFADARRVRSGEDFDARAEAINNTATRSGSIQEQLRSQWALSDVDEALRPLGEAIIGYIEDDGYLRTPLETIADRMPLARGKAGENGAHGCKPTIAAMERALRAVQLLLEPAGVAARDTRECLLLQIDAQAEERRGYAEDAALWALVRKLVDEHLEDLAQNRLPRIAEKTGESIERIQRAMERMRHLSLAPGRTLVDETPQAIVPDAIVEYDADQDRYVVYLNDRRLPNLRINREYAMMARDREAPKSTREFIRKNLSNASWLIDAVEQRKRTLERVIRVVVDAQRDYFDYGPAALKPLPMTQVAEQLGVHVATVSRAVADKHLLTPRGIVALRGFFSGGTQTQSGEDVSWDAVKAAMKEIVDAEDKKAPLSDDAIAEALKERGIEIARRTVAKYRDQLDVPAARLRRVY